MQKYLFILWLSVGWSCLTAHAGWETPANTNNPLGFAAGISNKTYVGKLAVKPERFETVRQRLDFIHDHLQGRLQVHVRRADTLMNRDDQDFLATPPARFWISPSIEMRHDDSGYDVSLNPDFDAEVAVPNLERRLHVFITRARSDTLPGADYFEKGKQTQVGVRTIWDRLDLHASTGIRVKWRPELFARLEWRKRWTRELWVVVPRQRFFWELEDGLGTLTSLTIHRWCGPSRDIFIQSVSAARYTTLSTDGIEWEQTFKIGRVKEAMEDKWHWQKVLGENDIAQGHTLRFSTFGRIDSSNDRIERYRLAYVYRRPVYKQWIYLNVAPGLEWAVQSDWDTVPVLLVGLDMLFWGSDQR